MRFSLLTARGWCRAELWCRLLSIRKDTSVIVIFSDREALYMFPLDWQKNPISDGAFTVEADRREVTKLGQDALEAKMSYLKQEGPLEHYRFYLASKPKLLHQDLELAPGIDEFLRRFAFETVEAAVKEEPGMTGMLCAVFSGDSEMIRRLAGLRADPNGRLIGLADLGYYDIQTLLMAAAKSSQEPAVLSTLLSLQADPNLLSRAGLGAAWMAREPGHVRVLLASRAEMWNTYSQPLNGVAGRGSSDTVRVFLECRCEPSAVSMDGFGPLHAVATFGRANQHATRTVELLMKFRADVNLQAHPGDFMFWECFYARVRTTLRGMEASAYDRKLASLPGATPISVAAVMGDKELVKLLLENQAELHIPNYRGDTPEDIARASGYTDLLPLLGLFST